MDTGIRVGHEPNNLNEIANAIVKIITASQDRETAVAALQAFTNSSSINNLSMSQVTVGDTPSHYSLETEPLDEE